MSEWEFLAQLSQEADCLLLLNVKNVYVNSVDESEAALSAASLPRGWVAEKLITGFTWHDAEP